MSVEPSYLFKKPTAPKAPVLDAEMLTFIDTIRAGLIRDGLVQLYQFGTFRLKWGKPRHWVNPRTGETGMTGPLPRVTFAPAKHLRELIEPAPKPARPLEEGPKRPVPIPTAIPVIPVQQEPSSIDFPTVREPSSIDVPPVQETPSIDIPPVQEMSSIDNSPVQETSSIDIPLEQDPPSIDIPPEKEYGVEDMDFVVTGDKEIKSAKKGVRAWQLGLLAAVPLIIMLLQAEFTGESKTSAALTSQPTPVVSQVQTATPPRHPDHTAKLDSNPGPRAALQIDRTAVTAAKETPPAQPGSEVAAQTEVSAQPQSSAAVQTQVPRHEDILYLEPSVHEVENGDSLWKLADEFLGDPYLWPYIYRANKNRLSDPDKLKVGMSLVIPGLQREPERLTDNDSEHVAEGYYQLYRHYKTAQRRDAYFYLVGVRRFDTVVLHSHQAEIDPSDWEWATSVRIKAVRDNQERTSGKEVADIR